jgi:hypothetical protein
MVFPSVLDHHRRYHRPAIGSNEINDASHSLCVSLHPERTNEICEKLLLLTLQTTSRNQESKGKVLSGVVGLQVRRRHRQNETPDWMVGDVVRRIKAMAG